MLDDADTKAWFFAAMVDVMLGDNEAAKPGAVASMDTPNRVILRVEADRLLNNYDGANSGPPWPGRNEVRPRVAPEAVEGIGQAAP